MYADRKTGMRAVIIRRLEYLVMECSVRGSRKLLLLPCHDYYCNGESARDFIPLDAVRNHMYHTTLYLVLSLDAGIVLIQKYCWSSLIYLSNIESFTLLLYNARTGIGYDQAGLPNTLANSS